MPPSTLWRDTRTHRQVWALALPMILSNLGIPLVALTDSALIGHLPQTQPLAAVALGGSLYTALLGILSFLRMATTGIAAQAAGRQDVEALRRVLGQALASSLGLTALVVLCALLGGAQLIEWLPGETLESLTGDYLTIRLLGLPAGLASLALVGWFLGTQRTRAPLYMLLTTCVLNIALDLWFVLGLDWGVTGVAGASALAEWSGLLMGLACIRTVLRQQSRASREVARSGETVQRSWRAFLSVCRDIFIRSLCLQGVFVLISLQGARLGEATVAANALLLNGLLLTAYALDGLAHALEALSGHAIGARNPLALRRALAVSGGWALLGSLGFSLLFLLAGRAFIGVQTDIASVRTLAFDYLPYLALLPLVAVWSYMLDGLFIAAMRAREMRNAMLAALLAGLLLGWLLQGLGNHGLWLAFLAFMLLRGVLLGVYAWRLGLIAGR